MQCIDSDIPEITTTKEHTALLPEVSVKVYTTSVEPNGKASPGLAVCSTVKEPELSVAVGSVQVTVTSLEPTTASTTMSEGQPETSGANSSGIAGYIWVT